MMTKDLTYEARNEERMVADVATRALDRLNTAFPNYKCEVTDIWIGQGKTAVAAKVGKATVTSMYYYDADKAIDNLVDRVDVLRNLKKL